MDLDLIQAQSKKGFAGCNGAVAFFAKKGMLVPVGDAQPGDIVFFDFDDNVAYLSTPIIIFHKTFEFNILKMARAMYDYTKSVLNKVSFDVNLFCIELKKALTRLLPHEIVELKIWLNVLIEKKPQLNECLIYLKS